MTRDTLMERIDRLVATLEDEGYDLNDIADALEEYLDLSDEFGYLR